MSEAILPTEEVPEVTQEGLILPALPETVDVVDLLARDIEEPPQLVHGILHRGSKMVVGGTSKSMKTWVLLDMAYCVALGLDWLGFTTTPGRVLYVNLELQEWAMCPRIQLIEESLKGIGRENRESLKRGEFSTLNLRGHAAWASDLIPRLIKKVKEGSYDLIVIDPIYKCLGGRDENSAGEIGTVLNELEKMAVQTGAAVVFAAHFSKGNQAAKESIDRIGGSGVFARDPDTILTMTGHKVEGALVVDATLRNFKRVEPFCVRWAFPRMRRDDDLLASDIKQHNSSKPLPSEEEFVALFPERGIGRRDRECLMTAAELTEAFVNKNYAKKSYAACRDGMLKTGIIKIVDGQPHNQKLYGVPAAVNGFLREQKKKSPTVLPRGNAGCRGRKKRSRSGEQSS